MPPIYQRYLSLNIDGSLLGLEGGEPKSDYFCAPKGAQVIGWAGVDGIHMCFVDGFGEMVFAVCPMNTPGDYVHPVAKNFTDFLRLLLACSYTAALDQAYAWNQEQFDAFLQENPPLPEQRTALEVIGTQLSLTPMEQPFAYIKALQAAFDHSALEYTEDFENEPAVEPEQPPWKVTFDGNFWSHHSHSRPGKEISLNQQFTWAGERWYIPAMYSCGKGLVMDFCVQIPAARIRSFMDKWNVSAEHDGSDLTEEQQMQAGAENPLVNRANSSILLNGTEISSTHGCGMTWSPYMPDDSDPQSKWLVQQYDLDPVDGWIIWRAAFPWATKGKPKIRTLSVTLTHDLADLPGPHFSVSAPGAQIQFTHPTTGVQHTLTGENYERQTLSNEHLDSLHQEFPTHYTAMGYTISPHLPRGAYTVTDCAHSDRPRPNLSQSADWGAMGVIGGADGPTAIFLTSQDALGCAFSSLHFQPTDQVEWRMVFHEQTRDDCTVTLL